MAGMSELKIATVAVSASATIPLLYTPLLPSYARGIADRTTETAAAPHQPRNGMSTQMKLGVVLRPVLPGRLVQKEKGEREAEC